MITHQRREKVEREEQPAFTEKLVYLNRVAKVVKGGKRLRFSSLVVVGDGMGRVGMGVGKSNEVPEAIRKGGIQAKKNLIQIPMTTTTIPHEITVQFGASKVMLRPAAPGTGLIAGGGVRAVLELAGIKDILTKSLGSSNPINVVKTTLLALSQLRNPTEAVARRKPSSDKAEKGEKKSSSAQTQNPVG